MALVNEALEELSVIVPATTLLELLRLVSKVSLPDVTYCEDMLEMAQQALRLNRMHAETASDILYKLTSGVK